jgi:hypothetical protein
MMGKVSSVAGYLIGIALIGLAALWLWGASAQANERRCIAIKASEREAFGVIDWITTGWDWPLHRLNGTRAEPIPCKPGVTGFSGGKITGLKVPDDGSMVSEALRGRPVGPGLGEIMKDSEGALDNLTNAPTGHRYLDRYLAEQSGNRAATPSATPTTAVGDGDPGLSPEARDLLNRRLQEMNHSNDQR